MVLLNESVIIADKIFTLVKKWQYRDKICTIVEIKDNPKYPAVIYHNTETIPLFPCHNGYVQIKENKRLHIEDDLPIKTVQIDWQGFRHFDDEPEDVYMIGFDSAHSWDTKESKSFNFVKNRTERLADEMNRLGI